jgi:hypothetical protein
MSSLAGAGNRHRFAMMHSSARRAGYPSDSSRAARQQHRTRPAGVGPLNSATSATGPGRTAAGRCRPRARLGAGPGEKPPSPLPAAAAARARCATVTAPGPPLQARARCPAGDYTTPGGGPAAATAPGRRCEPGSVPLGPLPERGPVGH